MHIIVSLLVALGGAFWAFHYFVNAAHEGRSAVNDMRGFIRSGKWSKKVGQRMIEQVTDPRESAAILLYQMAAYDGAVTERQQAAIVAEMRKAFAADEETAQGLYAFARVAVGQVNDAGNSLRKVLAPIAQTCTDAERESFAAMLEKIGEVESPMTDVQRRLVAEARRILFPRT
ncbi:MAG: hypothetical protein ABL957_01450 [Parvularculaceae bacterium]